MRETLFLAIVCAWNAQSSAFLLQTKTLVPSNSLFPSQSWTCPSCSHRTYQTASFPQFSRPTSSNGRCSLRMSSKTGLPSIDVTPHVDYLRDVASVPHPADFQPQLELLVRILTGTRGCTMLSPSDRRGLHPLVIPLARDPADDTVIGLLRQPLKPQLDLPVVRAGAKGLDLLAPNVELFIRRAAIEAVSLISRGRTPAAFERQRPLSSLRSPEPHETISPAAVHPNRPRARHPRPPSRPRHRH